MISPAPARARILASRPAYGVVLVAVAVLYIAAAKGGLVMASVNASATAIWPATGVAVAATLVCGYSVWPAILIGAFIANATTAGPLGMAAAIACGNTLEGLIAAALVKRFGRGLHSFDAPIGVFLFAVFAGIVAPLASAGVGIASLFISGSTGGAEAGSLLFTWWLGDAGGALIVTPALVLWSLAEWRPWRRGLVWETTLYALAQAAVSYLVFLREVRTPRIFSLDFVGTPLLIWSAFRLGPRVTATGSLLLSAVAAYGTWRGWGPFAGPDPSVALPSVTLLMAGITVACVACAAAIRERERIGEERDRLLLAAGQATADAEARRRQLDAILSGAADGITAQAPDGHLLYANDMAAQLCGLESAAELLATPIAQVFAQFDIFDEAGNPFDVAELPGRVALTGAIPVNRIMRSRFRESGKEIWSVVKARPIFNADGQVEMVINIAEDITPLKIQESQREQFLAAAAHDLQAPVTAIKGFVDLIQRRLDRNVEDVVAKTAADLQYVRASSDKLSGLVAEFLDLARLHMSHPLELNADSVDLVRLLREVLAQHQVAGVRYHLELSTTLGSLVGHWDPLRLERILSNLVNNAIKFSPDGGPVLIELERDDSAGGPWAVVRVSDRGVGIPETERERIFEQFHRATNAVGTIPGTGLGLSYARQIAELHGGTLTAESREGSGSTFTLRLPAGQESAVARPLVPEIASNAGG